MNSIKEKLYQAIENDQQELFEILSNLIKINSENFGSHGNEAKCAEFIADYFQTLGYAAEAYSPLEIENFTKHPDYLEGRNLESRKNCSVVIPGKSHAKKLMLASHVDTVAIGNLSNWKFNPLSGEIKDGKIYGRGACDDKYGCAISMFLIKKLKELDITLDYDLIFSGYCDEEYGGSNGALAACLKNPCDDCLSIDCREFELWDCGCGGGEFTFSVTTKNSVDNCSSVIAGMNLLLEALHDFERRRQIELEDVPSFKGSIVAQRPMRVMCFSAGEKGGVSMNKGSFTVTLYTTKTENEIDAELSNVLFSVHSKFAELGLNPPTVEKNTRFFHYIESPGVTFVTEALSTLGKENGMPLKRCGACLSDLPMFRIYGSPRAVALGAGAAFSREGGSHQANEYIECDKVIKLAKIIAGFIAQY